MLFRSRRQVTFFAPPKKVTKERRPLCRRPFGLPCATRPAGRLRNSALRASDSPRRLPPAGLRCSAALRGCAKQFCSSAITSLALSPLLFLARFARQIRAVKTVATTILLNHRSELKAPLEPPSNAEAPGDVGEDCLRPTSFAGRVPQPPGASSSAGNSPKASGDQGAAFFWLLFLAAQEK